MSRVVVVAALCVLLCVSAVTWGQIIYEPIQYQYGTDTRFPFYYGGSDPRVIQSHLLDECRNNRPIVDELNGPVRVYSDCIPGWNAALFGWTPDDARNEAYASIPRYFRKSELLAAAVPQEDGTWVVPARAPEVGRILITPVPVEPRRVMLAPTTRPHPILIIPKRLLEPRPPTQFVAAAR